jgi:hypothetical protein
MLMKNLYSILITVVLLIPAKLFGDGSASITLRPSHIDISSASAQSAVLVTLSGYSTDNVKYRLYNSSNQYNCWDAVSGTYISSTAYASGPLVLGSPTSSTTFWIIFERGTNATTSASYRDRVDPYTANNNTVALPAAAVITTPFTLSGALIGTGGYPLTDKYVVLGFNGASLVSATSSDLSTGMFALVCPDGISLDKVEIRTLTNTIITSVSGTFATTGDLGSIELVAAADVTPPIFAAGFPKVANIDETQADLQVNMDEPGTAYYVVVPDGATAPTAAEVAAGTDYGTVTLIAHGTIDVVAGSTTYSATITGLTNKTDYDIYVVAEDDEAAPNRQTDPVLVNLYTIRPPDVLLNVTFETENSLSPFTAVSVTGDQVWSQAFYSGNGYAIMNGYSGGMNNENEDWLISPALDLTSSEMIKFSFKTAMNYSGPALKVMLSSDFNGTFTATDIAAATWTDITSEFTYSTGSFGWVASGDFDLSAYTGTVYIAFVYTSTTTGAASWEVDDFKLTGYLPAGTDATLSDLKVDGVSITGFDPATFDYHYNLDAGTTVVPTVTYTLNDENASAVVTDATDLSGNAAARTTTVVVTAADATTKLTYSIQFNPVLEIANIAALRAIPETAYDRVYKLAGEVVVTGLNASQRNQKYVQDATGAVLIDDSEGIITTSFNVGDGITGLTGTLYNYFDMLEFIPYRDPGIASSTGNTLTPQEITVSEFKTNFENYESELVKITGVAFTAANGTAVFETKKNYDVTVGTDATVVRTVFLTSDLTGAVIPYMADVTGVAVWDYSTAKVAPRNLADLNIYLSDATLSDLKVNGTTVTGFASGTLTYNVSLPAGTTTIPTVTATATDAGAAIVITPATSLTGDAAARTAKIDVTSHDKTSVKNYTITFTVATSVENDFAGKFTIYPVPVHSVLTASGIEDVTFIEIFDLTGNKIFSEACQGENFKQLQVGNLSHGIYFIKFITPQGSVMKRFVKE